jgi:alcohol dehydrogenase class IV
MVTQGMKYNMQHAVQYIAMAAGPLGVVASDDDYVITQRCIKAVEDLRAALGLPSRLRDIPGITPDSFPKAAEIAFHDFFTPYNRRQPESPEELVALYHQAW